MIKPLEYQHKAVTELVEKTIKLLESPGDRRRLVFKAPTGSGKTVMASEMLDQLVTELEESPQTTVKEVALIWIAPNKLHEQSYMKMKNFFTETRVLQPVMYDELDKSADGYIQPSQVLFVNWESINKDKNIMVRDNEACASLYDICQRTKEKGLPIIVVIDEEHMYTGKSAIQSRKVLDRILPKVEIRISATPITNGEYMVSVAREDVIKEQMIKQGIVLNPDIQIVNDGRNLTEQLVDHAIARREELAEAYRKVGSNVNPLLLIQLPNDSSVNMSADDNTIAAEVKTILEVKYGITTDNEKLAVWLSNEKKNLDGIEKQDSMTEVLLFKQAIALGWDCPRAAVLLIFRKMNSCQFGMQTVGRILRMPEHKHYTEPLLNKGYVYTDLAKDMIEIVQEDVNYINQEIEAKRKKDLRNITLSSYYSERLSSDRNRLGPDFDKVLYESLDTLIAESSQMELEFDPFEE
ncbi:MAG: DEAD/DEAH box helicase family protein [Bacteroidales bacterium]|nr:DEAD/DEAH box helicase family protein [Bacteroidales bacterium]